MTRRYQFISRRHRVRGAGRRTATLIAGAGILIQSAQETKAMRLHSLTWLAAFSFCSALVAQSLRVTEGVTDYQVFQRDFKTTRLDVRAGGTAPVADGKEVEERTSTTSGQSAWTKMAVVQGGRWSGKVTLGAGGPYRLEFRIAGEPLAAVIEHVLVGDLWILAGQSNMEGVGNLE